LAFLTVAADAFGRRSPLLTLARRWFGAGAAPVPRWFDAGLALAGRSFGRKR
jgi:hypothetical protein